MEISQKNFWNRTNFQFGGEALRYTIKSESQTSSFSVSYNEISIDSSEIQTKKPSARNIGIVFIIVGVVHVTLQFVQTGRLGFSLWLALGILFFAAYFITKTSYSILQTEKYAIGIIKDAKHDLIYNEIVNRRKMLLYAMYGEINYDNNPDDETIKFLWLKNQNVISEDEFNLISEKISEHHNNDFKIVSFNDENKKTLH